MESQNFLKGAFLFEISLGFLALLLMRLFYPHQIDVFYNHLSILFPQGIWILGGSLFWFALLHWQTLGRGRNVRWAKEMSKKLRFFLKKPLQNHAFFYWIGLSIAAGLGEEFFFRGFLQTWLGAILSSILFGLFHALTPAYFILATSLGLFLSAVVLLTHSIWGAVCFHIFFDIWSFWCYRKKWKRKKRFRKKRRSNK